MCRTNREEKCPAQTTAENFDEESMSVEQGKCQYEARSSGGSGIPAVAGARAANLPGNWLVADRGEGTGSFAGSARSAR